MDHHRLTAGWCPLKSAAVCLTSVEAERAEMTANAPCTITDSLLESLTQQNEVTCKYPQRLRHKGKPETKIFYSRRRQEIMETCTTEQFLSFNKWVTLSVRMRLFCSLLVRWKSWKLPGICLKMMTWKGCLGTMIIAHSRTQQLSDAGKLKPVFHWLSWNCSRYLNMFMHLKIGNIISSYKSSINKAVIWKMWQYLWPSVS